jgi:predicted dehydrogenase/threonine dehydrogenase-like Zn-dependent dehydrogenase
MRQVLSTPQGIVVTEVPAPSVAAGGVLVAVQHSLISTGTELAVAAQVEGSLLQKALQHPDKVWRTLKRVVTEGLDATVARVQKNHDQRVPLGYSCTGTVIAVGAGVTDLRVGDRVACAGAGWANHADVVWVPRLLTVPVPPDLDATAAASVTLGAIALQGVRRAAPTLGETFLVVGLGLIGQLTAQLLRASGCDVLATDPDAARLALAARHGAVPLDPAGDLVAQVRQRTSGIGADGIIVCASTPSSDPVNQAMAACRRGARVVLVGAVGMDLQREPFFAGELDLRIATSYGPGRYDVTYEERGLDYPIGHVRWTENRNMTAYLAALAAGRIDLSGLVAETYPVEQAPQAYQRLQEADRTLGVLLTFDGERTATRIALKAQPTTGKVGVSLIGTGTFAETVLLPALQASPNMALQGLVSRTGHKVKRLAETYGAAWCGTDPAAALTDAETRLVVIATRHDEHAGQVIAAAGAGKAVFVEKPLCLTLDDLDAVASAVATAQVPCVVGFNRRFAPLAQRLRQSLAPIPGPSTVLYRVNAGALPGDHWLRDPAIGGGRLVGEGCHFIDWMIWLIGSDPVSLQATEQPDGDTAVVTLSFGDGSVGTLVYSGQGHPGLDKERIEVYRSGTVAVLEDFQRLTIHGPSPLQETLKAPDKGHQALIAATLTAIKAGAEPPMTFASALTSMRWTIKAQQALTGP